MDRHAADFSPGWGEPPCEPCARGGATTPAPPTAPALPSSIFSPPCPPARSGSIDDEMQEPSPLHMLGFVPPMPWPSRHGLHAAAVVPVANAAGAVPADGLSLVANKVSAALQRDLAQMPAKRRPSRALAPARKVGESWFQAQGLSWVARFMEGSPVPVAREAAEAIQECAADREQSAVRAEGIPSHAPAWT